MRHVKIMLLAGVVLLFITGCNSNENTGNKNAKHNVPENTTSESSEKVIKSTTSEIDSDSIDVEEIDVDELLKKMNVSKETVFFVGDSESAEYQVALREAKSICSELSIDLYQTDLGKDTSKRIEKKYQENFGGALAEPYDILACNQEGKLTPLEPFDDKMPSKIRRNLFKAMVTGAQIVD